jgi:hypothetical protein
MKAHLADKFIRKYAVVNDKMPKFGVLNEDNAWQTKKESRF